MHKVPDRIHVTRDDDLATAVTADIARRSVVAAFRRGDAIPFAPALLSLKHLFVEKVICGTEDRLEALVRHAHQLLPTKQHAPIVWRDSTDQHACVTKWSRTLASGANTAPDGTGMRTCYYATTNDLYPLLSLLLRATTTHHQGTPALRTLRASKALSAQLKKRKTDKKMPTCISEIDATRPLARHNVLLRRLPSAAVARKGARELRQLLLAFGQYGLATAGTDALAHVAQHNYDIHRESIAALDCENAYGTLSRTATLEILLALSASMGPDSSATALLMHVLSVYAVPGPTHLWLSDGEGTSTIHTVYQTDGIDQGENNGNLLYNLVYTLVIVPRWAHFYPSPRFGATLLHDDTSLGGPASPVDCSAAGARARRARLIQTAAAAATAAVRALAQGDRTEANAHAAVAASARAQTCRGTQTTIADAQKTKDRAYRAVNAPGATDTDRDAAKAARAALAALQGDKPPLITELLALLLSVPDPARNRKWTAAAPTAPVHPIGSLDTAYAAAQELAGALRAMLNPSPLPTDIAADASHEERHPMLYPGDTNRRGPSPITSLPAAINVWAYLTEHLVSTKIAKHKSVVVTHPDTEHPTAEPAWPDGTQLPHDGALVLAGCAIGAPAGRASHLQSACDKYETQLKRIFDLDAVPRLARLLACIHGTQPHLKFNHHLRGAPASDSTTLGHNSRALTAKRIYDLFSINEAQRTDETLHLTDRVFLSLANGGLGLADPTQGHTVMLAAVIDTLPAVATHPALAAAYAAPEDWRHSHSTLLRDAHTALGIVERALAAGEPATRGDPGESADTTEHLAFLVATTDPTTGRIDPRRFLHACGRHPQRSLSRIVSRYNLDRLLNASDLAPQAAAAVRAAARPPAHALLSTTVWSPATELSDAQATYFVHIRLALPLPMLPDTPCCHPRCKTAGPSANKDPAMLTALRQGWHQFQCRTGGHRIRSHNLLMGGVCDYAKSDGGYMCELVNHLHTGAIGNDQIDGILSNWQHETKNLAVDLTLSNIFATSYLGGAAVCAYKIIRKRSIYKIMHHEKACIAQGRNFMPWVHTIMGDTGPVTYTCFQTKIYKRLAATEKAKHQPIWRAQRRQLEAHAHAQALLYRNSATALEQLSIHPAAVQRNNGARRYEARRNFAGRR